MVLETKVLLDSQKLDAISFKVDVVSSDINHIRIGIAELKVAWVQRHEDEKRRQKDIRHKESIDR